MSDLVGQQLGNYRLLRLLGKGAFAQVYLGEHIYISTQVAVKVFEEKILNNDERDKIFTEAKMLSNLQHPGITRILDFGISNGIKSQNSVFPYIVMQYTHHGTLRDLLPWSTGVPLAQVVFYLNQIANALQYAHNQKVVHGDIKPENMLLDGEQVLLSDFGIETFIDATTEKDNFRRITKTNIYRAPECTQGAKSNAASDQYSLAAVIYSWLSGLEFSLDHSEPLTKKNPSISKGIEQVVMKALSKDPEQRYPTVKDFADALEKEEKATVMTQIPNNSYENLPTANSPSVVPVPKTISQPQQASDQEIYGKLQTLSAQEQKDIVIKLLAPLTPEEKNEISQVTGSRLLSQGATDFVWKVVVSGAVIVFVISANGVVIAAFVGVNVAPLITVFTAVVAFLGGLLAPSPVQSAVRSLTSGFKSSSKADGK
jgi:serine/threonine protein kinase